MADASKLLAYKKKFDERVFKRGHDLSSYHFSSIFLWQNFFTFDFEMIEGFLCVFANHTFGTFLYLPPLGGELNPGVIDQAFRYMNKVNSKQTFSRIENVAQKDIQYFDARRYKITEKSKEYCYRRQDIVDLKGNAYKSKRSSYNQFAAKHDHEMVLFDPKWTDDCLKLYDAWASNRAQRSSDDIYRAMLEENRGVHHLIFQYHDELGLHGRLILVNGKPHAYTFGYPLNEDIFCVLVEITNLDIKGLSVYLFSRFCALEELQKYQLINVMDDFAMHNIARTKQSFHPESLYPSYVVTERQ